MWGFSASTARYWPNYPWSSHSGIPLLGPGASLKSSTGSAVESTAPSFRSPCRFARFNGHLSLGYGGALLHWYTGNGAVVRL
jgi:hypothetical protein